MGRFVESDRLGAGGVAADAAGAGAFVSLIFFLLLLDTTFTGNLATGNCLIQ